MAITVKHKFVSAIADESDASVVRPSNWNDDHQLTGTVPVANGGTGAATLTGYVYGNGTSAMTASTTVPSTDITGLGTMATQNANAIAVTGGSINGTTVGATTASNAIFTYASTTSTTNTTPALSYNASNSSFVNGATVAGSYLQNIMQNKSATAGASTNFAVSNNLGTDSTYYGEFGMNSSVFSASTPADYFSLNNGIYYSGHDGDLSYGSGNGYKTYFAWGTTGQSAHVINATGAIGLNTNLGTTPALSGTTNFGTAGQVLTSGGSAATPTWATPTTGTVTSVAATVPAFLSVTGSPITSSGTLALSYSGTALPLANGGTGATSAPAANAALFGYTSTATAAGTTTLTNTSSVYQLFTGSTTQTIVLPVTSTLTAGWTFHIVNNSTGNLTVQSSGLNAVCTVIPNTTAMVTCILITGTTAASWEFGFTDFGAITGTGSVVLATSPTFVTPALGTPSSGTVTNLTGTASININGTVGATTPTTGVFTTATANSFIPNLSTVPTNGMYLPAANTIGFSTASTARMQIGATGGVSIGNTTDAGATNLSVTGTTSSGGNITSTAGNFISSTSGKGIDFTAAGSGTGTKYILTNYEEGTFTPVYSQISGGAITYTTQTGTYVRIGRQVTAYFFIAVNTNTHTVGNAAVTIPFTAGFSGRLGYMAFNNTATASLATFNIVSGNAFAYPNTLLGAALSAATITNGSILAGTIIYFI